MIAFVLLDVAAIICILKYKLPRPFPWELALAFALALFIGGLSPLGTFEKFYIFTGCLSALILAARLPRSILGAVVACELAAITVADALRLIPSPDVVMTPGELLLGGLIRRPYLLAQPNLVAGWALLLPFGFWTPITLIATQSRGALVGFAAMLIARFVPRPYLGWAALAGSALIALALLIRPGTALARTDFWREGVRFFIAQPWMGWGSGSYSVSLTQPGTEAAQMNAVVDNQRTGMSHTHNALVTIAAENGLSGLLPFIGLVVALGFAVSQSNHPARWGLLAFAVQQLFDDQLFDPVTALILGAAIGVCLFASQPQTNPAPSRQEGLQQTPVEAQVKLVRVLFWAFGKRL